MRWRLTVFLNCLTLFLCLVAAFLTEVGMGIAAGEPPMGVAPKPVVLPPFYEFAAPFIGVGLLMVLPSMCFLLRRNGRMARIAAVVPLLAISPVAWIFMKAAG